MSGKLVVRAATMTTDAAVANGYLDVDNDAAVVDVSDLQNVSIFINQIEDAGNATLTLQKSIDGTNWAPFGAAAAATDFVAGANKSIERTLSDTNAMPLLTKFIRLILTGHSSTGKYTMTAAGMQRPGYSG